MFLVIRLARGRGAYNFHVVVEEHGYALEGVVSILASYRRRGTWDALNYRSKG
jgi:hypothetical protein